MATNGQSHLELARKIECDIADPLLNFSQNYIDLVNECRNRIQELCDTRDRLAAVIVEVRVLRKRCIWRSNLLGPARITRFDRPVIDLQQSRNDWEQIEAVEHQDLRKNDYEIYVSDFFSPLLCNRHCLHTTLIC
jgi:hypothetical protein